MDSAAAAARCSAGGRPPDIASTARSAGVSRSNWVAVVLPRTTATQFDLDTPADLAVLALSGGLPPALQRAAAAAESITERYRQFLPFLCNGNAEVVVAGRVSSETWQYLERETACRVRMFAEERG